MFCTSSRALLCCYHCIDGRWIRLIVGMHNVTAWFYMHVTKLMLKVAIDLYDYGLYLILFFSFTD
jgi:hypothetical protein